MKIVGFVVDSVLLLLQDGHDGHGVPLHLLLPPRRIIMSEKELQLAGMNIDGTLALHLTGGVTE